MEPSARRYSTVTPSTSIRCTARLRSSSDGASVRVSLRKASSSASAGRSGLSARQRLPQAAFQHHVAVVRIAALGAGFTGRDLGAVQDRVAERLQPGEGGVFDDGFGELRASKCNHRFKTIAPTRSNNIGWAWKALRAPPPQPNAATIPWLDSWSRGGLQPLQRRFSALTSAQATPSPCRTVGPRASRVNSHFVMTKALQSHRVSCDLIGGCCFLANRERELILPGHSILRDYLD